MSLSSDAPALVAQAASIASRSLALLSAQERDNALTAMHAALQGAKAEILAANARDVENATAAVAAGTFSLSILKRLDLSRPRKWEDMLQGVLDVRNLEDPGMSVTLTLSVYYCQTSCYPRLLYCFNST